MNREKELGFVDFKITITDGDVNLGAEKCYKSLLVLLKSIKDEFSKHKPKIHQQKDVGYEFRVMDCGNIDKDDEPCYPEYTPEEWEGLKSGIGWVVHFIEIYDKEDNEFSVELQLNEGSQYPTVQSIFISLEYWNSLILLFQTYNFITADQAREFSL